MALYVSSSLAPGLPSTAPAGRPDRGTRPQPPSPRTVVPDVVYVGYMRAGSTYLRSYFSVHPQIQWTRFAWYFQLGRSDAERQATYGRFFESITPRACLIDVYESLCLGQYFPHPPGKDYLHCEHPEWSPEWAMKVDGQFRTGPVAVDGAEIARRIGTCLPRAKVLIVLRDQVQWLSSMYVHYLSHLPRKRRSFCDFLNTLEGKSAADAGMFDVTLGQYFNGLGRDRVHVLLLEQLALQEAGTLRELCQFLGIDFFPHNPRKANRNAGRGDALVAVHGRLLAGLAAMGLKDLGVLTEKEKSFLRAFYSATNSRTSQLLSLDLSDFGYPC